MYYNTYTDGLLPIGELFIAIIPADGEADVNIFTNLFNEECLRKMREPVVGNGYFRPVVRDMKKLVDMAWYYDPDEPETNGFWDEKAREKMREPLAHGFRILLDSDQLRRLTQMV